MKGAAVVIYEQNITGWPQTEDNRLALEEKVLYQNYNG